MTRFVHDQFAKQYLKELLSPFGTVETSRDVASEVRQIDVLFIPTSPEADTSELGLLGRMAATPSVFEPFRNPIIGSDIRSCTAKLSDVHTSLERQANREKTAIADLPLLWILSPTVSAEVLAEFWARPDEPNWMRGIYFLAPGFKTAIVAIHQLPRSPDTLWLRVLGKANVQKQAIAELKQLPENNPFQEKALELVYNLLAILDARQDLDKEDRELIMELSPLYLERLENATQLGIEQGDRRRIESFLQVKYGVLDEELSQIIEPLMQLSPLECAQLIMELNRSEILARFREQR